jgi:hypothetical protein
MKFIPVILESPYAGDVMENIKYAQTCMKDMLKRGEAPFASHLLYTQVLDDTRANERARGIEAGFAWKPYAYKTIFYIDRGWSKGMRLALEYCHQNGIAFEVRNLYPLEGETK